MANGELEIPNVLKDFFPKERKLYELLVKRDETGKLSRMLHGAVRVLRDLDNPVRFAQAATTIRSIADSLLEREDNKSESYIDESDTEDLKKCFRSILEKALTKISDDADKAETSQHATNKFEQLTKVLCFGSRTRRHRLLSLLGTKDDLKKVSDPVQKATEQLANIYNYFTEVLHRHRENEPSFESNWLLFQDFLILITSEFFEIAAEIQPFLEDET